MTLTTPAAFETVPLDTALRPAELVSREWLTRGYVRVRLEGDQLKGFHAPGADDHVRLFFAPADGPLPATPEEWRELPSREYTPLNADPVAGWVEFDLVLHGDGPGSEWAATAPPGSRVAVGRAPAQQRDHRRPGRLVPGWGRDRHPRDHPVPAFPAPRHPCPGDRRGRP